MIPHLPRYQDLAVDKTTSAALNALDLRYPRLLQQGFTCLIRGIKVMLDRDLAELYGVETSQQKRAVRRNIDRFPEDFMFELTKAELEDWRCQFGTLKRGAHSKYPPMAFTEQGVAMLSSVLNSNRACVERSGLDRAAMGGCSNPIKNRY